MALTHALVVRRFDSHESDDECAATVARWRARHATTFADIHAFRGVQSADLYACFELATPSPWSIAERQAFEATLGRLEGDQTMVDRLECVLDVPGASIGARTVLYYVVETDAADGWLDEVGRWYDTEHMPGLAAVPGCIRARRFINRDRGPYSYACYDLAHTGVTESEPWLAVRATDWSSRVRPQFRNTRRTMFRALGLPVGT